MKLDPTRAENYIADFEGDSLTQDVIRAVYIQFGEQMLFRTSSAFYRLAFGDRKYYKGGLIQICKDQVGRDVALFVSGYLGGEEYIPARQKTLF
jgi:hypothetical protein